MTITVTLKDKRRVVMTREKETGAVSCSCDGVAITEAEARRLIEESCGNRGSE